MGNDDNPPPDDPDDEHAFARDSDVGQARPDDREGPPDGWESDTWRDFKRGQWWYRWAPGKPHRLDMPPLIMLSSCP